MRTITLIAGVMLLLVGCSSDGAHERTRGGAEAVSEAAPFQLDGDPVTATEVTAVKSYTFDPQVIEIAPGSEVTWTNEDDFPHTVRLLTGADVTKDLPIGQSTSITFDDSGTFYYECSLHPQQMRGKVIVSDVGGG